MRRWPGATVTAWLAAAVLVTACSADGTSSGDAGAATTGTGGAGGDSTGTGGAGGDSCGGCPPGYDCIDGQCECLSPYQICAGECVSLTSDERHCGGCGHVCPEAEVCVGGACAMKLFWGDDPVDLAIDATHLYWIVAGWEEEFEGVPFYEGAAAYRVEKGMAAFESIYEDWSCRPTRMGVDATHVYFGCRAEQLFGWGDCVRRVETDGSTWLELAGGATSLALDDDNVYSGDVGAVWSTPKAGGEKTALLTGLEGYALSIVATATHVYVTTGYALIRYSKADQSSLTIADGAMGLVVDEASLYWTTLDSVRMAPIAGGDPTVLASGQQLARYVAKDDGYVYWGDLGEYAYRDGLSYTQGGSLWKVPIAGGEAEQLVSGLPDLRSLIVDEARIYWLAGAVYSMSK